MIPFGMVIASDSMVPDLPGLAHDWWGIGTWAIIALVAIVLGAIWIDHRKIKSTVTGLSKTTHAIKNEVTNDHETNLRADVDETRDEAAAGKVAAAGAKSVAETVLARVDELLIRVSDLADGQRRQAQDIGGIRKELRDDREATRVADQRLDRRMEAIEKRIS